MTIHGNVLLVRRCVLALATGLALLVGVMASVGATAKPPPAPSRLLVRGEEFDILLSQLKINPGNAIIQFQNAGEDPHDLWVQREGSSEQHSIGELPPGEVGELSLRLERDSRYALWCSLGNHRQLGMDASLRVRRKRR